MIVANKNKIKDMAKSLSENGAGRSLWKDARLRFIQNKAATLSLFILILIGKNISLTGLCLIVIKLLSIEHDFCAI